jgi:hypothetical protein
MREPIMNHRRLGIAAVVMLAACLAGSACGREETASAPPIQVVTGPSAVFSGQSAAAGSVPSDTAGVIAFPPRNEPYAFRQELERKYRDGMGRPPSSTYVDIEGDIVWTQEYLRYRVNQCDHAMALQKVLDQIDGRGIAPVCGTAPSGGVVAFPPRNEPYAFRQELERKYRDGLGRSATSSYVDIEGAIVWTQEYLRYRVNQCGHVAATQKVLGQIDGEGIAPVCTAGLTGLWDGFAPTYWNAPFTMDIALRGTQIIGTYRDQYDYGTLWGTYAGGSTITINVYFGDGGLSFTGEFDGPDKIKGTMRPSMISRTFPFWIVRRP